MESTSTTSIGTYGSNLWLASTELTLDEVLDACPQVVIGNYLAITSIDSGSFYPTDDEKRDGWEHRNGIGYSPLITSIDKLARDGYDEWYVFKEPFHMGALKDQLTNIFEFEFQTGRVAPFVNFGPGFLLSKPNSLTELFWKQYDFIRPHCFISEGDVLNFVTADKELFRSVETGLKV